MARRVWQVQSEHVMAEVLDGEAVIIDMASGRYHAAAGVAGTIWEAVTAGRSLDGILADVRRLHSGVPEDAGERVVRFLDELVAAGLAVAVDDAAAQSRDDAAAQSGEDSHVTPWRDPALESHDDLQDLLLLDPVHEVTEAGWPHAAPPQ